MKTCLRCGNLFEPKDERSNRPAKYCSRDCGRRARYSQVTLTCRQCGRDFQRKAYMADWSQERGPFCGFACYGEWQKLNALGADNPNYSPNSVHRDAWNYQQAHREALARDNQRCQLCNSSNRLHVHHVGNPDNHALDNLQTLCAGCHRKQHPGLHGPDGKFVSLSQSKA